MARGVYVYAGDLSAGSTVKTCINGDCHTATVVAPIDPASAKFGSLVQDQRPLPAGDDVQVSIAVVDSSGKLLDELNEKRGVPDGQSECACAVLIYQWNADGQLARFTDSNP